MRVSSLAVSDSGLASLRGYGEATYPQPSSSLTESLTEPFRRLSVRVKSHFQESDAEPTDFPEWVAPVFARIKQLLQLPYGWDSYGGRPPSVANVEAALTILSAVMTNNAEPPWIVPLPSGGLQLEWHRSDVEIEIAIDGPDSTVLIDDSEAHVGSPEFAEALAEARGRLVLSGNAPG